MKKQAPFPPYKNKVVEWIPQVTPKRRREAIQEAGYNTFLLHASDVLVDLLTDSGTNAMFEEQRAQQWYADESYAGSESFRRSAKRRREAGEGMADIVERLYGLPYIVPTHQGRAAEEIASKVLISPGQHVLSNMYFTTSRAHAELQGARWHDISIPEAHDPQNEFAFKGNIDIDKLRRLIEELGARSIAFVRIEACLNMAGGQPFSMESLSQVKRAVRDRGISSLLDATRAIENCYFIKMRESGYSGRSIEQLLRMICEDIDWLVVSAKKDAIVNIGGFLATRDRDAFEKVKALLTLHEGFIHYGGLAGEAMEAITAGLKQAVKLRFIRDRVGQVHYLGKLLDRAGVPVVHPFGGHAIYLDGPRFAPHIAEENYRAQSIAAALYTISGVRAMERGRASAGRNPKTGEEHFSSLELVRLTVPRLVYSSAHFEYAAEQIIRLYSKRESIPGLKMVYEPELLRFFQARFAPCD